MYDINLYPPVFNQSLMPSFAISSACRIYFQISDMNTVNDMITNAVQVIVRDQSTNNNMLANKYLNDIKLCTLVEDSTKDGKDKYYIQLVDTDIKGGFSVGKIYKVQIRFTSTQASSISGSDFDQTSSFANWLSSNMAFFSQWSMVALIQGINTPGTSVTVNGKTLSNTLWLDTNYAEIRCTISGNEILATGQVQLKNDNGVIIQDSGILRASSNSIRYNIHYSLEIGIYYTLNIILQTNSGYTWTYGPKTIVVSSLQPLQSNMKLEEKVNNSNGYIQLGLFRNEQNQNLGSYGYYSFESVNSAGRTQSGTGILALIGQSTVMSKEVQINQYDAVAFLDSTVKYEGHWSRMLFLNEYISSFLSINDRIIIRRASSATDFTLWDNIGDFTIEQDDISNLFWYDYTAEPGVWYRYQVIRYNSSGTRTAESITDVNHPLMLNTDDLFLNADGEQLIIKFDPVISSLTTKVAESVTDTIGSQYPFIRRNGNVHYKTFSLSGTISYFMDVGHNVFNGSQEDIYGNSVNFYKQYNKENNINFYNDVIYERHFRQKVIKFLESSSIKLLRSVTEGNILVKLGNVTFTPNQTLGRRIYGFNCTAYEVGECNEKNYKKYNIIKNNIKIITKQEARENL